MDPIKEFEKEKKISIRNIGKNKRLKENSNKWIYDVNRYKYSYNFTWLGRPIIQYPQDMIAVQEIIWQVKPDMIIETGIAHGGSIILSASILELLGGDRIVVGVDVDIRKHNREEIEKHPMFKRIVMLQGSSVNPAIIKEIRNLSKGRKKIMVLLDSNHTEDHVLKELELYSSLVSLGSYLVVFDTVIEDMPEDFSSDRPWHKGNNPKTALYKFLRKNKKFKEDREIGSKLLITVAPGGYLKRTQ